MANKTPPVDLKYSRRQLLSLSNNQLRQFATPLGLSPDDPRLLDRIIRILRFKDGLINDLQWSFPNGPTLDLNEIVCARLKSDLFPIVFSNSECTPLAKKIATSLIRIAATRIFSNASQSILEPIVNSIDAYHVLEGSSERVGKFGLGFFSMLYWVLMNNATLTIDSTYLDPLGSLIRWIGVIKNGSKGLEISLSTGSGQQTGTIIRLEGNGLPLNDFLEQIKKLKDVESVQISINNFSIRYGPQDKPIVNIIIANNGIIIADNATGISLEVLLGSLLIPSISTKQIQVAQFIPRVNPRTRIVLVLVPGHLTSKSERSLSYRFHSTLQLLWISTFR